MKKGLFHDDVHIVRSEAVYTPYHVHGTRHDRISMNLKKLREEVNKIGQRMIVDENWKQFAAPDDILFDPKKKLFAHDFFLDERVARTGSGVIITGINPGGTVEGPSDYVEQAQQWMDGESYAYARYYVPLRALAVSSGVGGPILWTELAYCANGAKSNGPKNRTIRYSVNTYLKEQVNLLPEAPILAVGNRAYYLLSFLFPGRHVVGVPHPSGRSIIAGKAYKKQVPVKGVVSCLQKSIEKAARLKEVGRTLAEAIAFDKKSGTFCLRED